MSGNISAQVHRLSRAAWRLRALAPADARARAALLPFALTLFTDERRQPDILSLLNQLPPAGQIRPLALIFRHYGLVDSDRQALAQSAMAIVQRRGHLFIPARLTVPGADGQHGAEGFGIVSAPIHSSAEGLVRQHHADLGFVSPVFATQSHPDAHALGGSRAVSLAQTMRLPTFALGGITETSVKRLYGSKFVGIGAIGAFGA